jgi:glucose/arabinose dehydrogenase
MILLLQCLKNMPFRVFFILFAFGLLILASCKVRKVTSDSYGGSVHTSNYDVDSLPPPFATKSSMNFSMVTGWKNGQTPVAPQGFTVTKFADGFDHPRWIYVADNGDIFVAESNTVLKGIMKIPAKLGRKIKTHHFGESANRITMFRDANKDGVPESRHIFMQGLDQPFGMLILNNKFYVANTHELVRYDYKRGDTSITGSGDTLVRFTKSKINQHWTRNIITDKEGKKIYIAIGSSTNIADNGLDDEVKRACILEINPDGTGERVYAEGLRNPVGIAWAPGTKTLWAAVNERDDLGDELVPDYFTSVGPGAFYGWPFAYFGRNPDPRMKDKQRPEMVDKTIVPDIPLGSHTASLGLVFYEKKAFPSKYHNGAFITQHGSWNRSILSGYKVVFVPFKNGKPSGPPEDFLTGFIDQLSKDKVHGRPVGIAVLADGSMLVSDDVNNIIWRVKAK